MNEETILKYEKGKEMYLNGVSTINISKTLNISRGRFSTWLKNEGVSEEKINSFRDALNDVNNDVENELSIIEDIVNDLAYENGFVDERDCMID